MPQNFRAVEEALSAIVWLRSQSEVCVGPAFLTRTGRCANSRRRRRDDAQPVRGEQAEEAPEPEAGVGAALFETRGNDEPADDEEENDPRPAQKAPGAGHGFQSSGRNARPRRVRPERPASPRARARSRKPSRSFAGLALGMNCPEHDDKRGDSNISAMARLEHRLQPLQPCRLAPRSRRPSQAVQSLESKRFECGHLAELFRPRLRRCWPGGVRTNSSGG